MRHALYFAPFGQLAAPRHVVEVAAAAEEAGWDGIFLWDHVLRPRSEALEIADTWVTLAAVAAATKRVRLGPMVTPITRRRPQKLAREAVTLDHLSGGRVTLGLGLGVDSGGELTKFGEITDPRIRAQRLDEGADLLRDFWTGEEVTHRGAHFTADGVIVRPRPVQEPSIPIWCAARGDADRPVRRAARFDGIFPIEIDLDRLGQIVDLIAAERGDLDDFDIAVIAEPGTDLVRWAEAGATWAMHAFDPGDTVDDLIGYIEHNPLPRE